MKRCIIIGSKGYLGRHLHHYLDQMGIVPECYDIVDKDEKNYTKIDLTDKLSLEKINLDVDYIFMISGITGTFDGFDNFENYVTINELGLLNLLDAIRRSPYRPKIIFPSTRLVYRGVDKPLKEEDEKETKTIYAVNKLACEGLLQAYNFSFDIPYTIFRLCVPYGNLLDNDYSFGTVGFFIKMASNGKDISLYGDGRFKRTFTHIKDVCYQMTKGAFNSQSTNKIFNIGGEIFSLKEVADIIASQFDVKVSHVTWPEKDLRIESSHTYFDDEKIQKLIGSFEYLRVLDFSHQI